MLNKQRKRLSEYQRSERLGSFDSSFSLFIGASIIAATILLASLMSVVGTQHIAAKNSNKEVAWLVNRLTGKVSKCRTFERGKAWCETEISNATISEPER